MPRSRSCRARAPRYRHRPRQPGRPAPSQAARSPEAWQPARRRTMLGSSAHPRSAHPRAAAGQAALAMVPTGRQAPPPPGPPAAAR
eukprot:scaffold108999_cov48-Phaeocystis_antarctica.AAC.2